MAIMKQETKEACFRIFVYFLIVALLVTVVIGYQKTEAQKERFEQISESVDEFTQQLEEQHPRLEEIREATQEKVDQLVQGA